MVKTRLSPSLPCCGPGSTCLVASCLHILDELLDVSENLAKADIFFYNTYLWIFGNKFIRDEHNG